MMSKREHHAHAKRHFTGVMMVMGALLAAIVAATGFVGLAGAGGPATEHAQIVGGGTSGAANYVVLHLPSGTTAHFDSAGLYKAWRAAGVSGLSVGVQLDRNGHPKRVRYHGTWYGSSSSSTWFWLLLGIVGVLVMLGLLLEGVRRVMRHPSVTGLRYAARAA